MKRVQDLTPYESVLPYASEIFGVYQPLIGWSSKRQLTRIKRGFDIDRAKMVTGLLKKVTPALDVAIGEAGRGATIRSLEVGSIDTSRIRGTGTFLGDRIAAELPPLEEYDDSVWDRLDTGRLNEILRAEVTQEVQNWQRAQPVSREGSDAVTRAATQLARESAFAGLLTHLKLTSQFDVLKDLFYKPDRNLQKLLSVLKYRDPLEYIDPKHDIERANLSPIGIVHLFRQYFFEFDTFLGPPVGHVWLSPGSMVELVEVSTRRTLVERTIEQATESVVKTEKSTTEEDEISDAIKEENRNDTKFGMNSTVNQGWITGSATASASLNIDSTQSKAREQTHRRMRQQTEKLSTEIRRNFKSTFRTVTETTDTSSKRYVLNNTTDDLINYELRRKMRQVGVQVQDIGTYLCWQTFVDDPGRNLGIAKMVHIAKDPDLGAIPPPESIPQPGRHSTSVNVDIPFVPKTEDTEPDEDMDEAYRYGVEVNTDDNEGTPEKIQYEFGGFRGFCELAGYEYSSIEFDYGRQDVRIEVYDVDADTPGEVKFKIRLKHINFHNSPNVRVIAQINWTPSEALRAEIDGKNKDNVAAFNEATRREFEKAYLEAARDRINKAGEVRSRPFEELREEERIVVYRALIQDMLTRGIPMPDDRTRHVVSELLNSIFDIDKMLYFVSPEWWRPRMHASHQALGKAPASAEGGAAGGGSVSAGFATQASVFTEVSTAKSAGVLTGNAIKKLLAFRKEDTTIPASSTVSWGGTGENRADNYYVTEDSEPAPLGASLGWLLQLDGDNMRNAFLNAPWVKAVIPVRPGKERAAMNWLEQVHVEGTEGLDSFYSGPAAELAEIPSAGDRPTIREAIHYLCDKVAAKHAESQKVDKFPKEVTDDANKVAATPVDKVFEHGFYPLDGGFRVTPTADENFEVFDQWVEVLPTDQVVPVPVTYDPKTGRQV
ncbi:hypothetical protein JN086_24465 [Mycolicibacterium austroafricanum]|uniref:Peptidoglycan-binding protein n=1 Tax=Mycolicibacterium austroafricanum TaxID=39687 RepID=A0ABT8HGV8_MYCAO|nr:hypothetical protein [Mycolicibacterium austroafricanum]MDN4520004.1 hypothetical protein [Mycolicibacterium austroafricanum]QRZ06113.1 hypothetical protein JN090_24935 [Mycolicibacterium austroafricanum]QZT67598.1 hypothetical protein JN086_24465 [Mycolicibacterium austroafricanum]